MISIPQHSRRHTKIIILDCRKMSLCFWLFLFPQDVNDQVPMFSEDVYEVNVTEDTAVGASLLTVTASDADIEENAAVLYSVGSGSVVTVDGDSGDVELVTMLDYEMNSRLQIKVYT